MGLQDLADIIGYERLITELEQWMPTDDLDKFIDDVKKDYDIEED